MNAHQFLAASEEDRERTRAEVLKSLRLPRKEATEEVNWLLSVEAQQIRSERDVADTNAQSWKASVEARLQELDDQSSTGYEMESARAGLDASLSAANEYQAAVQTTYDQRRQAFAEMLVDVRDSKKVLLSVDVLAQIHLLNTDQHLAQSLGMEPDEFADYYGSSTDIARETKVLSSLQKLRRSQEQLSALRAAAPQPQTSESGAVREPVTMKTLVDEHELVEPTDDLDPEFDY